MADHEAATPQPGVGVPAMPEVAPVNLYPGSPYLLVESGLGHSIGWQEHRKTGPGFVVVRMAWSGRSRIVERFPLTEEGWVRAWRTFSELDAKAAEIVSARLTTLEARRNAAGALADLDARSTGSLLHVAYNGGSGDARLASGSFYDVRFLADRVAVYPSRSSRALTALRYPDVEAVEISGSDRAGPDGQLALIILGLALTGALLGLLIFRLPGLLLGAVIFGLIGLVIGSAVTKIETTIRIRGRAAEFYFLNTEKRPGALRIELSEPLRAVDSARTAPASEPGDEPGSALAESIPDQLSKLASLLQQGVITREEFESLKAGLISKAVRLEKGRLTGD